MSTYHHILRSWALGLQYGNFEGHDPSLKEERRESGKITGGSCEGGETEEVWDTDGRGVQSPEDGHVACFSINLSLAFPATCLHGFCLPDLHQPLLLFILSLQNLLSLILCEKAEILGEWEVMRIFYGGLFQ